MGVGCFVLAGCAGGGRGEVWVEMGNEDIQGETKLSIPTLIYNRNRQLTTGSA